MTEKIEWYQEVFDIDPASRIFLPLARLLKGENELERAVSVLRRGLLYHSDMFEARLLLIECLYGQHDRTLLQAEMTQVTDLLKTYPIFFEAWANVAQEQSKDLSLAVSLLSQILREPSCTFVDMLTQGLVTFIASSNPQELNASEEQASSLETREAEEPPDSVAPVEFEAPTPSIVFKDTNSQTDHDISVSSADNMAESMNHDLVADASNINEFKELDSIFAPIDSVSVKDDVAYENNAELMLRTRSMADLLADQGNLDEAMAIYAELETHEMNPDELAKVQSRMYTLQVQRGDIDAYAVIEEKKPVSDSPVKGRVLNILESLAARLEARSLT